MLSRNFSESHISPASGAACSVLSKSKPGRTGSNMPEGSCAETADATMTRADTSVKSLFITTIGSLCLTIVLF